MKFLVTNKIGLCILLGRIQLGGYFFNAHMHKFLVIGTMVHPISYHEWRRAADFLPENIICPVLAGPKMQSTLAKVSEICTIHLIDATINISHLWGARMRFQYRHSMDVFPQMSYLIRRLIRIYQECWRRQLKSDRKTLTTTASLKI